MRSSFHVEIIFAEPRIYYFLSCRPSSSRWQCKNPCKRATGPSLKIFRIVLADCVGHLNEFREIWIVYNKANWHSLLSS
jgi:hypothetical protein